MYLLIIFLPLMASIISLAIGRFINFKGVTTVTTGGLFLIFIISCKAFYEIALLGNTQYITIGRWIYSGLLELNWGFQFDTLTVVMLIIVTVVSLFVHYYSIEYMKTDPHNIQIGRAHV